MSLFKRGYQEIEKEEKRREESKKNSGGIFRFFLKEGEAEISFLTEEPINFYEHSIQTYKNGKQVYDNVPCPGSDCPHCANGSRPTFKSAWLIIDHRPYTYTNKEGKEVTKEDTIKLYVVGTKVAGLLQRKSKRYGLVDYKYLIERIGKDTSTTYSLDNLEKSTITTKEILELLPEQYKEEYDGDMEVLYAIIEKEIAKLLPTGDEEEEEEVSKASYNKNLVSVDDEEEEEEPKKSTSPFKKKTGLKLKRK